MASCMLCASWVLDGEAVCPHCGGATEADPTPVPGSEQSPWGRPVDATAVDPVPPDGALAPPRWEAPPPTGPPEWGPSGDLPIGGAGTTPPGYGPPGSAPPAHGPPGYAPPGYGPPGYAPPPYGPPSYAAAGYGVPVPVGWSPRPATSGMAVAAFVVSLVSLVTALFCYVPILAAPVGAGLGHAALGRIRETGEGGRGLALAGVILGWIGTGILLLGIILVVVLVAASGSGG